MAISRSSSAWPRKVIGPTDTQSSTKAMLSSAPSGTWGAEPDCSNSVPFWRTAR